MMRIMQGDFLQFLAKTFWEMRKDIFEYFSNIPNLQLNDDQLSIFWSFLS